MEVAEVIDGIKRLVERIKGIDCYKECRFEQIADEEKMYRLIIWFHDCAGEIVISEPEYSPYHFVKFEAVSYSSNIPTMIVSWYDHEGDTLEHIVAQIERAIGCAGEYRQG